MYISEHFIELESLESMVLDEGVADSLRQLKKLIVDVSGWFSGIFRKMDLSIFKLLRITKAHAKKVLPEFVKSIKSENITSAIKVLLKGFGELFNEVRTVYGTGLASWIMASLYVATLILFLISLFLFLLISSPVLIMITVLSVVVFEIFSLFRDMLKPLKTLGKTVVSTKKVYSSISKAAPDTSTSRKVAALLKNGSKPALAACARHVSTSAANYQAMGSDSGGMAGSVTVSILKFTSEAYLKYFSK